MSFWHEARKPNQRSGCTTSQTKPEISACIRYPAEEQPKDTFKIYAHIWVGEGEPIFWFRQGWIELWPQPPILATDFQTARRLQLEQLEELETHFDLSRYITVYATSQFVETIEHPSKNLLARIYLHDNGIYEVTYAYLSYGRGGEIWVAARQSRDQMTCTNDLESARRTAHLELEELAEGSVL